MIDDEKPCEFCGEPGCDDSCTGAILANEKAGEVLERIRSLEIEIAAIRVGTADALGKRDRMLVEREKLDKQLDQVIDRITSTLETLADRVALLEQQQVAQGGKLTQLENRIAQVAAGLADRINVLEQ